MTATISAMTKLLKNILEKPSPTERLGAVMRTYRKATKLSQDRFADRIDMHRAYYSAIERGEKNITLDTLLRVADGLGVNTSDLFGKAKL
jgi:transcriptional regulator with XRE-family HTH domain